MSSNAIDTVNPLLEAVIGKVGLDHNRTVTTASPFPFFVSYLLSLPLSINFLSMHVSMHTFIFANCCCCVCVCLSLFFSVYIYEHNRALK